MSEFIHWHILILAIAIFVLLKLSHYLLEAGEVMDGDVGGSIFCGVLLGINVYASMLQRYNRARLHNVIDRMEEKEKMPAPYK